MRTPDLSLTTSGEFDVTEIEAYTEPGTEFVDRIYLATMQVVDSGRVIVPNSSVDDLLDRAKGAGLTHVSTKVA